MIGVNQSTISREFTRNTGQRSYRHNQAQLNARQHRQKTIKPHKMTSSLMALIDSKLREEWSPEQISGRFLDEKGILISYERIYQYVWADKQARGDLYKQLRRQGKKYDKRRNGKSSRGQINNCVSIDECPKTVNDRSRIGGWEIDTMIGKGQTMLWKQWLNEAPSSQYKKK